MSKGARQAPLILGLIDRDIILAPSYLVLTEVVERAAQTNKEGRKRLYNAIVMFVLCKSTNFVKIDRNRQNEREDDCDAKRQRELR